MAPRPLLRVPGGVGRIPFRGSADLAFYKIPGSGSRKAAEVLCDTRGHVYSSRNFRGGDTVTWRCVRRGPPAFCKAIAHVDVVRGDVTKVSDHSHLADDTAAYKRLVTAEARLAVADTASKIARPQGARRFAEEAARGVAGVCAEGASSSTKRRVRADVARSAPAKPLARVLQRQQASFRPPEPARRDSAFQIDRNYLGDGFVRADVPIAGGGRAVVFQMRGQRGLLHSADTIVADATYRVVGPPFKQLLDVHSVTTEGDALRSAPLGFALMTHRTAEAYVDCLLPLFGRAENAQGVRTILLDYEPALWQAFHTVAPRATLAGCAFHWVRAVFRNLGDCGLKRAYAANPAFKHFARRVLAMPYVPAAEIPGVFQRLVADWGSATEAQIPGKGGCDAGVTQWLAYISREWVDGGRWRPAEWSVFGLRHRTTNVSEGYHNRLKELIGLRARFYKIAGHLKEECVAAVAVADRLIRGEAFAERSRLRYRALDARVHRLWRRHLSGGPAWQLLCAAAYLLHDPLPEQVEDVWARETPAPLA